MGILPLSTGGDLLYTPPAQENQGQAAAGQGLNPLERVEGEEKRRARLRPPGETKRQSEMREPRDEGEDVIRGGAGCARWSEGRGGGGREVGDDQSH